MTFTTYVRSSTIDGDERVTVEGISPLDRFEVLQEQITKLAGPALGKLFCEPLISEGNGAAATTVSWYAAYEGEATALTALGTTERNAAEAVLRARIEALQPAPHFEMQVAGVVCTYFTNRLAARDAFVLVDRQRFHLSVDR